MLLLSAIGLTVPAVFHFLAKASGSDRGLDPRYRDRRGAARDVRGQSGLFTLKTHRNLYASDRDEHSTESIGPALGMLVGATIGVAWMSELLVGSVAETARALGMSELFIGVVIVAIIGNAAEHYSAVVMAARNQMDVAISIAVGSSTQIALFVAPTLVFLSYLIAPAPMDLLFTVFEWSRSGSPCSQSRSSPMTARRTGWKAYNCSPSTCILALGFYFLPVRAFR